MKSLKFSAIALGIVGLLFLGACSNSDRAANTNSSPATSTTGTAVKTEPANEQASESKDNQKGGQVVESGPYHLELVPEKEDKGTHIDLYLQRGDNHAAIPNANVTAQVQMPDGTQKSLPLKYDAEGKHYTALLSGNATGQYQVKVTADIKGEKVNGRFGFKQ